MDLPQPFLEYDLPRHLIAQTPAEPRDASRLLVVDRGRQRLQDHYFSELPELLLPGDLLVVNDSRVLPARLQARRSSGGSVELLLLEDYNDGTWEALARPLARLRPGEVLTVGCGGEGTIRFLERRNSTALIRMETASIPARFGETPLPPYIQTELQERERYQTVYASQDGSAAAPTAGLHFTTELLDQCRERGVLVEPLTLHVGIDTFRPLVEEDPSDHRMHSEWYSAPARTWAAVQAAQAERRRVVSVGTTTTRVLETLADALPATPALSGRTTKYIRPPYDFQVVDGQITNFHLPRTTLLLMIGALAGDALLRRAYAYAIEQEYRFYSFGDAMLIV